MEIRTKDGGFSESFKMYVVDEIESGRLSQSEAMRKFNILGHSTVQRWCQKYGSLKQTKAITKRSLMTQGDFEQQRLNNEIRSLKQELEDARMKNVVLETFVDIAEKELGIPIRKKYGARQSER